MRAKLTEIMNAIKMEWRGVAYTHACGVEFVYFTLYSRVEITRGNDIESIWILFYGVAH